jgi:cell division cycle 14
MECGFVDFNNFDIEEFEHFEKVENGDLTWLSHRTCAFAGPHNTHSSSVEGYYTLTPEDYIPHFKKKKVGMVIRLNKKYYDEGRFTREGIQHRDLYYLDGSTPTEEVLQTFLSIMEGVDPSHRIAVHCKAGLGRTGSCIGAYWMKHYGWTAAEVIGWMRVCRPGMVIGPQQHWMERQQEVQWRAGAAMRQRQQKNEKKGTGSGERKTSNSPARDSKQSSSMNSPHTRVNSKGESQGDFLRSRRSPKNERR